MTDSYPHAAWVSREYGYEGIEISKLIEVFELEKEFHNRILATESAEDRKRQYGALYERVHQLLQRQALGDVDHKLYDRLALTFRRELQGKSVLDVGCGNGVFLKSLARLMPHGELWGLDTSAMNTLEAEHPFKFIQQDITNFTVPRQFDVVFSHQVFEHIAPADTADHLRSIHAALAPSGKFIVCLPNRFWGPQDITRIVDNTFRGRVPAMGSHLNESSYLEMVPLLKSSGFDEIRTVLPLAAFIPFARGIRVRPWINQLLERNGSLRDLSNMVGRGQRPIFKNPIMLVCVKS
jgi:SAM-dependent methyltransferase